MSFDLVLFDCDGVLVDSEPVANRILAEELGRIGLSMDYDEVCRAFVGLTLDSCVERIEARLGRPVPDGFLEGLQRRTFEAFRHELRPVPGVHAALERIVAPVCVASSGEPEKIRLSLGLTGLLDRFEGRIFSATRVPRGKPHPDLFLHAARSLGAVPTRCAVVEDSGPGIAAGIAAGMTVFAFVPPGHPSPAGVDRAQRFATMEELPGWIEGGSR